MGNSALLSYSIYHPIGMSLVNEVGVPEGTRKAVRIPTEWVNKKNHATELTDQLGLVHRVGIISGPGKAANASYEVRINCAYDDINGIKSAVADEWNRVDKDAISIINHGAAQPQAMKCSRFCIKTSIDTNTYVIPSHLIPPPTQFASKQTIWRRVESKTANRPWFSVGNKIKDAASKFTFTWEDQHMTEWSSLGKTPSEVSTTKHGHFNYDWQLDASSGPLPGSIGWIVDLIYLEATQPTNAFCNDPKNDLDAKTVRKDWNKADYKFVPEYMLFGQQQQQQQQYIPQNPNQNYGWNY